ncbi:uncharacterized protein LOC110739902 [Chenopodium quinoa]|uniref:uncharacterized protein LOC110739902 n=1 Tax=Chenopodium quinoa TaxID=63459 RepID=UPI000B794C7C|nr:uncharacterized protein LOC110739902 [Chenopodium quinoa]
MSPSSVVNVFKEFSKEFSEDQLIAIRAIGFGSLEFLKVSQLPLQLGFWMIKLLTNGKKQFPKNSLSVNNGELSMYLKDHKSAGPMFKRNFVVLCVSTLMSGGQNKNVNHDVLRYLTNVAKIKDLNWSKFILDSLVKAKIKWDELPTRCFPGSLLFLMLLYVDQFVIEEVRAKRETPVLKGWITNMLSSREKLKIFKGRLGIFDKNLKVVGPSGNKQPKMETSVPTVPQTNEDVEVDPKKKCLMDLAEASTKLVLAYMDFHEKHELAVNHFPHNEKIRKLKEDAMGICDEQRLSSLAMPENHSFSFSQDDEYWQDSAVIEAWDRFFMISANEKNVESSFFARADCLTVTGAIDVTKIAVESVQIANSLSENEGPAIVVETEKVEGGSSIRSGLRSSVKKGFGTLLSV